MNKLPTINIKGKEYVMVKDRISAFNSEYKNGMIMTNIVSNTEGKIIVKAIVTPDVKESTRYFTGHSQADVSQGMINKTSALENAETSAVGRALAMMGIGVIDSVASADEVKKAQVDVTKDPTANWPSSVERFCMKHSEPMKHRGGETWDHRKKGELDEKNDEVIYKSDGLWYRCIGKGYMVGSFQG